jgi:anti-sigma B factor antagonist
MRLEVKTDEGSNAAIIEVQSESLDAGNVKAFKEAMQPVLDAHGAVLIDLGPVGFVDSSGLGALLSCLRAMNNRNGQLKIYGMAKPVRALFELVRMHRIFAIYNTREEALATL